LDKEYYEILETLRKRGRKSSDLFGILSLYRTKDVHRAVKKLLRKRKEKDTTKGKVEEFAESFYQNYYNSTGRFPSIKKVRELVGAYFGIPLSSKGYLPSHIEKVILRAKNRVKVRAWRQAKKNQSKEGG
jgi:hypothetical protein